MFADRRGGGEAKQDDSKKDWASSTIFTLWKDLLHVLEMIETAHSDFVSTLMDLSDKQVGKNLWTFPQEIEDFVIN